MGAYLEDLLEQTEREERWNALRDAMKATPAAEMDSYRAETEQWEISELSDADRVR